MPNSTIPALPEHVAVLIRNAVSSSGSYKVEDTLFMFEESLTIDECVAVEAFLTWVCDNNKTFGWNIQEVYAEFQQNGQDTFDKFNQYGESVINNLSLNPAIGTLTETAPPKGRNN